VYYMYLNGMFGVTYVVLHPKTDGTSLPPPVAEECTPLLQSCDPSLQWSQSQCCNKGPCLATESGGLCQSPGMVGSAGQGFSFLAPGSFFEGRVEAVVKSPTLPPLSSCNAYGTLKISEPIF
jgi:hypothetical protein